MKVLAICRPRPGANTSEMAVHLRDEAEALEQWRDAGHLLEAYSPGGPGAVLILDIPSLNEVQSRVSQLPLCVAGLIETELIGLHPLQY
jgi:hypothetical protein